MAEYIFNCPHCGESIDADDSYCGMEAECPHCACKIIVPERHKVMLKKASQISGSFLRFCAGLKCMTKREFWTLKHSIIVGQAVVVALLFIAVVLLLGVKNNGNDGEKRDVGFKVTLKNVETQSEEAARTEKKLQPEKSIANIASAETPSGRLLTYAEQGEASFVEKVLKENPTLDVNRPRAEGNRTALYLACEKGYSDIVKLLLERKADAMIWKCAMVLMLWDTIRPLGFMRLKRTIRRLLKFCARQVQRLMFTGAKTRVRHRLRKRHIKVIQKS